MYVSVVRSRFTWTEKDGPSFVLIIIFAEGAVNHLLRLIGPKD